MTNNPRIDGVSRELIGVPRSLLENAIDYMEGSASPQVNLWRAKLLTCIATMPYNAIAAPVVERQPVYQERYGGGWMDIDKDFYDLCLTEPEEHDLRIVYTAPPQLAELQDRIDELADLLKQAREHVPQAQPLRGLINANLMQHTTEKGPKP